MITKLIGGLARKNGKISLFVVLFIAVSVIFASLYLHYEGIWYHMNIPTCPPHFLDSYIIATAAESHALGYDPLFYNPRHPTHKVLNYPRIWHYLSLLGYNQNYTNLMGYLLILLYFTGVVIFLYPKKFDNFTAFFLALAILSPAAMLGMERGNPDTMVFFILALALTFFSSFTALLFFLFAAALKLYPVFGFGYLLREKKGKFWSLFLLGSGVFMLYVLLTLDDLKQVYLSSSQAMPGAKSAFGVKVISKAFAQGLLLNFKMSAGGVMVVQIISYVAVFLIIISTFIFIFKKNNVNVFKNGQHLDAFRVGAGIYIGTFLLGQSFDYRLMFMVFTIPQLASWSYSKEKGYSFFPMLVLSAVVFSCWSYIEIRILGMKLGFLFSEASRWTAFSGLFYLFLASLPDWFTGYFQKPHRRNLEKPATAR